MKDAAGNYLFNFRGREYRVIRMNVFQQREFFGKMKSALNESQEIEWYSDGCNAAQDWLFPLIQHRDTGGDWRRLTADYLPLYLESISSDDSGSGAVLPLMNSIFAIVSGGLFENFTRTGAVSNHTTSNPLPVDASMQQSSQNNLSTILSKSHLT